MSLVADPQRIRLALLGMVEENGHPYSWSAIINGRFDGEIIAAAGYPMITDYLRAQPVEQLGIAGAEITHVWCDRVEDARQVARSAGIEHVAADPESVIGQVDAVIIPTDKGAEHLDRARSFIEAGLPIFIDKPLTDRADHLQQFMAWQRAGRVVCSSSAMRYAREFAALRDELPSVGGLRLVVGTCAKSWERYGIHALEAVYGLLPPDGWLDVCNTGSAEANMVHARHQQGVDVFLGVTEDMFGGFCHVTAYGTSGRVDARFTDSFTAFKAQLQAFVDYLSTGRAPFPFAQTVEQMRIIIAGLVSRAEGGRRVSLAEIAAENA